MRITNIDPKQFFIVINSDWTGRVVNNDKIIFEFKNEKDLDDKLNFLQKGGSIDDLSSGVLPKSIKKIHLEKKNKKNIISSIADNNLFTSNSLIKESIIGD